MPYKILAALFVTLTACAPTVETSPVSSGPKQTAGTLSGMVIGGAQLTMWLETVKTKELLQF